MMVIWIYLLLTGIPRITSCIPTMAMVLITRSQKVLSSTMEGNQWGVAGVITIMMIIWICLLPTLVKTTFCIPTMAMVRSVRSHQVLLSMMVDHQ